MGQKVNQSIFRLGLNNSEWNYKYIEKNAEESSLFLYKNKEILNYIDTILKSYDIVTHSCKIEYTKTSINLFIKFFDLNSEAKKRCEKLSTKGLSSYLVTKLITTTLNLYFQNKQVNIKLKHLNQSFENKTRTNIINKVYFKKFKKLLKNKLYKNLVRSMFISAYEKNSAKLIADVISIYVNKHKKKHYYLMSILKNYFEILIYSKFSKIKGIKIKVSGRINGAPRAKTKTIQIGSIPLQSFNSLISYHNSVSYTSNGSLGVKVWICQKVL